MGSSSQVTVISTYCLKDTKSRNHIGKCYLFAYHACKLNEKKQKSVLIPCSPQVNLEITDI